MTPTKRHKLEIEICRCRSDGNVNKIPELMEILKRKHNSTEDVVNLMQCELKLNNYLSEFPMVRENVKDAKIKLLGTKTLLEGISRSECKDTMIDLKHESTLMLAKIMYAEGNLEACLSIISPLKLTTEKTEPNLSYLIKYASEIYAIKGLCKENINKSDIKTALGCYVLSIKSSIKYIEKLEQLKGTLSRNQQESSKLFSDVMKAAFERAPLLYIKLNDIWEAISQQRYILTSLKTGLYFAVQQQTSKDLAALLLRGVTKSSYKDIHTTNNSVDEKHLQLNEESILLLQIAEAMMNMDPVLDMAEEHTQSRRQTLEESSTVYDLMVIAYSRHYLYSLLCSSIERSMKYIFNEFTSWWQYGLSLQSAGRYGDAVQVFQECSRIDGSNSLPSLFAAKIYYEELNDLGKAEEYARHALVKSKNSSATTSTDILPEVYLLLGMIVSAKSMTETVHKKRCELAGEAIDLLIKSNELDDYNHKPLLYLSIIHGHFQNMTKCIQSIKSAIKLCPNDLHCLHVYVLILSSQRLYMQSCEVLDSCIRRYPDNIMLMLTKCQLDLLLDEPQDALQAVKIVVDLWKTLYEDKYELAICGTGSVADDTLDGRSMANLSLGNGLELETSSISPNSIVASKLEQISECNSNTNQFAINSNHPLVQLKQEIWLLAVKVYLSLSRNFEASQFLQDAIVRSPLSPDVLYMKGQLAEACGDEMEASALYRHVLTIHTTHIDSMHALAQLYLKQAKFGMAEKVVRDAIKINPFNAQSWETLSEVLHVQEEYAQSAECSIKCNQLQTFQPLFPFSNMLQQKNVYL